MVMDSAIMTAHPDLASNINLADSASFLDGVPLEFAPGGQLGKFSHATHVAGIIAAGDNGFGTTGVAPDAEFIVAVVGDNNAVIPPSAPLLALLHAVDKGVDVVNMSWNVEFGRCYGKSGFNLSAIMTALSPSFAASIAAWISV